MKGKLIAAGGALATAATFIAMATPASAGTAHCDLSVADMTHSLRIDAWGVFAGRREADACQGKRDEKKEESWKPDWKPSHDDSHDHDTTWNGHGWNGGWDNEHDNGYHSDKVWPVHDWGVGTYGDHTHGAWGSRGWGGYGWPGTWFDRF
ncbi:hypothetical protein [Nonomuraea sp. NPDC049709]|uniref:hypothetical protein n=1 Tax=Nonomuraea sp. NPDC049709 TaxID=3154736 RepID=UPI00343B754A